MQTQIHSQNTNEIDREEWSRLRWQCRRGMLELDALLDDFITKQYHQLDEQRKNVFKQLLNFPDQLLFDYFFTGTKPIDKDINDVIERIRNTNQTNA